MIDLVRRTALREGVPAARILVIPQLVHSTHEEALAIRHLAEARRWNGLLIITSPFHTRRARAIFSDVFRGSGITIRDRAVMRLEPRL